MRVNQWILKNATLPRVILAFAVMSGLIYWMNTLTPAFQAATDGHMFFDMQIPITEEMMLSQLPSYTEESKSLYMYFMVIDYLFPPMAGLFTALLWGWMMTRVESGVLVTLSGSGLLLFPFISSLLDWLENIGFLGTALLYPSRIEWLTQSGVLFRQAKLLFMGANAAITLVIVLLLLTALFSRRKSAQTD